MCDVCGGTRTCPVDCRGERREHPEKIASPERLALMEAAVRDPAEAARQHRAGEHRIPMDGACDLCADEREARISGEEAAA